MNPKPFTIVPTTTITIERTIALILPIAEQWQDYNPWIADKLRELLYVLERQKYKDNLTYTDATIIPNFDMLLSSAWPKSASGLYAIAQIKRRGYMKIGKAQTVETRLKELQCGNPEKLEVVAWLPPPLGSIEGRVHDELRDYRVRGEWFVDCAITRRFMRDLLAGAKRRKVVT